MDKLKLEFSYDRVEKLIISLYRCYLLKKMRFHMVAVKRQAMNLSCSGFYEPVKKSHDRFKFACELVAEGTKYPAGTYIGYIIDKVETLGGQIVDEFKHWEQRYLDFSRGQNQCSERSENDIKGIKAPK